MMRSVAAWSPMARQLGQPILGPHGVAMGFVLINGLMPWIYLTGRPRGRGRPAAGRRVQSNDWRGRPVVVQACPRTRRWSSQWAYWVALMVGLWQGDGR